MPTCFDELLGIRTACTPITGLSGLNIEDIGITTDECDSYINKEYGNGQAFIEDKIRFATELVKSHIANHFSSSIITTSLVSSQLLGQYQDSLNLKSGIASNYGGISVTLKNPTSYFKVFVNSVSLQISSTQSVNVLVYDLISGTLLDTIAVSCVANVISTTVVNKVYSSSKRKLDLIFVYDTTGISSNNTLLSYTGCTSCNGYRYSNYYISSTPIYLPTSSTKIRSSLLNGSHTFGLSINYSIQCGLDNWLCEIANLMALPILYKTGEEIMKYAISHSKRQNSNTNIDYERNKERLMLYQSEFYNSIESTLKKINLPKNDICFKCNKPLSMAISLP